MEAADGSIWLPQDNLDNGATDAACIAPHNLQGCLEPQPI